MLTKIFQIISDTSTINKYFNQYTGLLYILYNNLDLSQDKSFIISCLNKFNLLDKSIFYCCLEEAKTIYNQHQTDIKNKSIEICNIDKLLLENNFITKKEKRFKYNIINKLYKLKRNINKDITFGGKENLRKITKYHHS